MERSDSAPLHRIAEQISRVSKINPTQASRQPQELQVSHHVTPMRAWQASSSHFNHPAAIIRWKYVTPEVQATHDRPSPDIAAEICAKLPRHQIPRLTPVLAMVRQ